MEGGFHPPSAPPEYATGKKKATNPIDQKETMKLRICITQTSIERE